MHQCVKNEWSSLRSLMDKFLFKETEFHFIEEFFFAQNFAKTFFSSSSNQITSLLARLVFLTALHIVCRFSAKWRNSWDHIETKKHDHDFFPTSDLISTLTDSRKLFLKVSDFTSNYPNNSESKLWLIS